MQLLTVAPSTYIVRIVRNFRHLEFRKWKDTRQWSFWSSFFTSLCKTFSIFNWYHLNFFDLNSYDLANDLRHLETHKCTLQAIIKQNRASGNGFCACSNQRLDPLPIDQEWYQSKQKGQTFEVHAANHSRVHSFISCHKTASKRLPDLEPSHISNLANYSFRQFLESTERYYFEGSDHQWKDPWSLCSLAADWQLTDRVIPCQKIDVRNYLQCKLFQKLMNYRSSFRHLGPRFSSMCSMHWTEWLPNRSQWLRPWHSCLTWLRS